MEDQISEIVSPIIDQLWSVWREKYKSVPPGEWTRLVHKMIEEKIEMRFYGESRKQVNIDKNVCLPMKSNDENRLINKNKPSKTKRLNSKQRSSSSRPTDAQFKDQDYKPSTVLDQKNLVNRTERDTSIQAKQIKTIQKPTSEDNSKHSHSEIFKVTLNTDENVGEAVGRTDLTEWCCLAFIGAVKKQKWDVRYRKTDIIEDESDLNQLTGSL